MNFTRKYPSSRLLPLFAAIAATGIPASADTFPASDRQSYSIYVDSLGVMRRSDNNAEVSYYGTNYTVPFAHAYRALGYLDKDRKEAIRRDVSHMKRLGFNGFRLHLWDAELADSLGNLLDNDHLDLLDYLIAELERNGIDIVLTAQTNFGNGYPEKNIDTGAFTYDFDKCRIHDEPAAQDTQETYLRQLAGHVNRYNGLSYSADRGIIAMEINNEPCHSGNVDETRRYIDRMASALRGAGFDKPVLYNVSHNPKVTEAYYQADIDGTTYQWYPVGLVAGHERKGNFLPTVDSYPIPWSDSIPGFDSKARLVYEFDPGDLLYSYMYPAIARTFRKEGFQWITQFAYDPTDIAQYNTEYQTHFLNLIYTPAKALSMMVAAEAARDIPRGKDFGAYPADTMFGNFRVSYEEDLSELASPEKFYYSNTTGTMPPDASTLRHIAGHGSSPVVEYEGTGAYFIDRLPDGGWRLEVMPDVAIVSDPFEKPSLKKEVARTAWRDNNMTVALPDLGEDFHYTAVAPDGNKTGGIAVEGTITVSPGVYLLSKETPDGKTLAAIDTTFAVPAPKDEPDVVVHTPATYVADSGDITLEAEVFGTRRPDKVEVYSSDVSFWRDDNPIYRLEPDGGYTYRGTIPADASWGPALKYNIVVWEDGKARTFPADIEGTPLDWDAPAPEYYTSDKVSADAPLVLLRPEVNDLLIDMAMIPEAWDFRLSYESGRPVEPDRYRLTATPQNDGVIVMKRYVGDELKGAPQLPGKNVMVVKTSGVENMDGAEIALVGKNGATYSAPLVFGSDGKAKVALRDLRQRTSLIVPAPYPTFLPREIEMQPMPFDPMAIDFVELIIPSRPGADQQMLLEGVWLEDDSSL